MLKDNISNIDISIIIPAYNCEKYLISCVESVISQNLDSYEIIIVDDGSNDTTLNKAKYLMRTYRGIKTFTKENGGAASARNFGLKKAQGKLVLFLDSDDLLFGTVLKESISFSIDKNIDIFISNMSMLNQNKIINNEKNGKSKLINNHILEYVSSLSKFPGSSCSKIFNKNFLVNNNLLFFEGIVNEDIDFMINCLKKSNSIFFSDNSWYLYRQNVNGSVTNIISTRNCLDMFQVIKRQIENTNLANDMSIKKILSYEYSTLFFYYYRLSKEEKLKIKKDFNKYCYLLKYGHKKEIVIFFMYKILRLDITSNLLFHAYSLKRRIKNVLN